MQFFQLFNHDQPFTFLSLALLISLFIFLFSWFKEPRKLFNGVLFTFFIIMLGIWFTVLVLATNLRPLLISYFIIIGLIVGTIALMAAFSWVFFLWNAYFVWQRESHNLSNLLTLFIGLLLIIAWIIVLLHPFKDLPDWLRILLDATPTVVGYLLLVAYNFLVNLGLYQLVPKQYDQDYLIILGAGLYQGEIVTPLLAARINRAIQYALKQVAKGRKMPKLIMSGGQGSDEKVPEAQAMAEYAIARGINPKDILRETESKNTYQNMLFSGQLAAKDAGNNSYKAKFFSNNYHIFRASLFAKKAGLSANGVGCYTRFYFLPNAIVREFAGVLVMNKKRHILIISLILLFFIILSFLTAIGVLGY
ncbi:YdcF family protein [Lactobacillus sp. ESL0684]|uniref:YdcF family protein n=1 Tax=unclassified Lactobacillus TaxID=2620435 RepID=UPI0023F6BB71|nr:MULTISPECIES: ElyC/SanA/YdcF family protein [unclassified Lactobacillus]WEV39839.1 YdcF family protein [Lactobacillus sp. ESL0681]WEV43636.1 YdcF family protein [Lactobacillus sp. ESL0684]